MRFACKQDCRQTCDEYRAGFNESDVREEVAVPFLTALGYAKGTNADILREQDLRIAYPFLFLGRKKPGRDPELRGRPDYVLRVIGVCRWVFEIKAPTAELDRNVIEQALSYARHPEINGELIAFLNGREFLLFGVGQTADEEPIFATRDCAPGRLAEQLRNILSPAALRRDRRPDIDRGRSLGGGLRSKETIRSGSLTHGFAEWDIVECPPAFKEAFKAALDQAQPLVPGSKFLISGGDIERMASGAIIAIVHWNSPYQQMDDFLNMKGLNDIRYVCLDEEVSSNPKRPSTFDCFMGLQMQAGEEVFDMLRRETTVFGMPATAEVKGQATGHIEGRSFIVKFQQETLVTLMMHGQRIVVAQRTGGIFEVRV